ncbi:MAG: N-acetyl-gamma-glutamyl-phosphate reductase [Lachnospiraceae bacterium]|nr:N-acetyl-gamma-glutamyl-phosphate reductase [Lachnospiraceae bacterium]
MTKVYIDGSAGTTGLRINERFKGRDDIDIIRIPEELRKDNNERAKYLNEADIAFLCLPDDASREAVSLMDPGNDRTVLIDASTAHRTDPGWAYGIPELSGEFREKIRHSRRIAVPGCYASGFIMTVYPLIKEGVIPDDYPVTVSALSGYSGAGKKAIAMYEGESKGEELYAPRQYALSQQHKHLKEMQHVTGLKHTPIFTPVVDDYYCGMLVTLPLYTHLLKKKVSPGELRDLMAAYYEGEAFVKVKPFGAEEDKGGFLSANDMRGRDDMEIYVTGNDERIIINASFDNLGKGASGAAIQCMNIVLGLPEATGLNILASP